MKYIGKRSISLLFLALFSAYFLSYDVFADPIAPAVPQQDKSEKALPANTDAKQENGVSFGDYLSGKFAESNGDNEKSVKFLRDSYTREPGNTDIAASLYSALIATGNIEEALPIAKKIVGVKKAEEGNDFPPALILAIQTEKEGHYDEAAQYLKSVQKTGFNSLLVPLLQNWLKLAKKDLKAPVDVKDILPNGKMLLPHIYLNAALINELGGYEEQAKKQYETAANDTKIETLRATEAVANYYFRKGSKEKYEQAVNEYKETHGESIFDSNNYPATLSKPLVSDVNEGFAESLYTIASIFHGVRTPADEVATLRIAIYLRPDFSTAKFLLANAYELTHSYKSAIATYRSIAADSPYYTQSRIMAAYDEAETGNKTFAYTELDKIAEEYPHQISALLAKGDILRTSNDFKQAINAYNTAIARIKTPRAPHWVVYFSRGICYDRIGKFAKTEVDMKKALEMSPDEADILNYLGYSWLVRHRNIAEAKKMIESAYDARPEDPQIIDSMGYALYSAKDYSGAQEYFQRALERIPDDPTVNEHLGDTYWQLGRKREASYQWQRALNDKPDEENKKMLEKKLLGGLDPALPVNSAQENKSTKSMEVQ
jgi:tetratricopeptide (TPR) repeat protein